jgi:HEAT repeat protein
MPDELNDLTISELEEAALRLLRIPPVGQSDELWEHVCELQERGEEQTFTRAAAWCEDADPLIRELGADVLAQLGHRSPSPWPFDDKSLPILLGMLRDEQPQVREAALAGIGYTEAELDDWNIEDLRACATDEATSVRSAAAHALNTFLRVESDDVQGICFQLMEDLDDEVRNWATFQLGSFEDLDSGSIREALLARVRDTDAMVRAEALSGLALRKDERMAKLLFSELRGGEVEAPVFEAIAEMPDAKYLPLLTELQPTHGASAYFKDAVEACQF